LSRLWKEKRIMIDESGKKFIPALAV